MRYINSEALDDACLLAFQGVRYDIIGSRLGVSCTTMSNWAKRREWKALQKELHEKKRQQGLDAVLSKETSTEVC